MSFCVHGLGEPLRRNRVSKRLSGVVHPSRPFLLLTLDSHFSRLLIVCVGKYWMNNHPLPLAACAAASFILFVHSRSFVPSNWRCLRPHSSDTFEPSMQSQSATSLFMSKKLCIKTGNVGYGRPFKLRWMLKSAQGMWASWAGIMTK